MRNKIYLGLILFFVFEYMRPSDYLSVLGMLRANSLIPLSLLLFTMISPRSEEDVPLFEIPNAKTLIIYGALFVISIMSARLTYNAFVTFRGVMGYIFLFYILVRNVKTVKEVRGIFMTLTIIHLVIILLNPQVLDPHTRRYIRSGPFLSDGNDFALSLCICLPMCVFLVQTAVGRFRKILWSTIVAFLAFAVLTTQSRGGSLALVAVVLYLINESRRRARWAIVVAVVGLVLASYGSAQYLDRMSSIAEYETDATAQQRIEAWKAGARMAADHPLTGVGAGGFSSAYGSLYRPPEYAGRRGGMKWANAHSIYFQLLGELGFPGLIMLVLMLTGNFIGNRNVRKTIIRGEEQDALGIGHIFVALNGSIIGYAVGGAFLTAVYYPHLYVILGLVSASRVIWRKRLSSTSQK